MGNTITELAAGEFETVDAVAATELTIATGVVTVTQSHHTIDTQADAASDDLDSLLGGSAEMQVLIRPASGARTVALKHAIGANLIACPGATDISLADATDWALLVHNGTQWTVLASSCLAGQNLVGNLTGNVTGNLTGNVTGNVTGDLTGNVTGNTSGSSGACTGNAATATLAASATALASTSVFLSTEQTGNGGAQNVAHGLGVVPSLAFAIPSDAADGAAFTVSYGAHDATNVVVTVTNTQKYRVVAFK